MHTEFFVRKTKYKKETVIELKIAQEDINGASL
jgi:hypothetical protein